MISDDREEHWKEVKEEDDCDRGNIIALRWGNS